MHAVTLEQPDDFEAWRDAARALALARVDPSDVIWSCGGARDLFGTAGPAPAPAGVGTLSVPQPFIDLAKTVICHRDPERFARLYALLVRLQSDRTIIRDAADPQVRQLEEMAKAVRRDVHKMRAFVRFRALDGRMVAWFEPEHHIVRHNAGFFMRRFANMAWSILTPAISIHWDGTTLTESSGAVKGDAPDGDPVEEVWKTYYASIFNPARVKIGAMLSEMPRKYWKNMPETALIPGLVATARARASGMIERAQGAGSISRLAWDALRDEAMSCTRCPLHAPATQTVFGEGPVDAALIFIGEQPGDQEDLAGRPFIGPAGLMFDKALAEAGIDRRRAYVTNAVKHFKFEPGGKRRIHAKPGAGEIEACRWWLDQERALIRPEVTVALGATAARSLFGRSVTIAQARGFWHDLTGGSVARVTIHPSSLLRIEDPAQAENEYQCFVEDLRSVAARIA